MHDATPARAAILYRMVLPDHVCPFGLRALRLLEEHGFDIDDRALTTREATDALKDELGVEATPQVFVDGRRIGGSDELARWLQAGMR